MSHRLCCCLGDVTCAEWCECLPDTCIINRIEIVRTLEVRGLNNQIIGTVRETIRLINVDMQYMFDGCKCWMENIGGAGNGQIEYEFIWERFDKTCSYLNSQGCPQQCFPPVVIVQKDLNKANLQNIAAGAVRIDCDDPCNPCLNPCTGCPTATYNMLHVDAIVAGNIAFTDYCDPSQSLNYNTSWPVRSSFIARNGCLTSNTFNSRGLRIYDDNAWQTAAFPLVIPNVCAGEQKFGWTCGGVGPVFTTNPQYESYWEVEQCQTGYCAGHTCVNDNGAPSTYQCICNGQPGDPGYTYQWTVTTRSHDVQITV